MVTAQHAARARGVALGLLLDRVTVEPPDRYHPVAAFGSLMQHVERATYRDTPIAGCIYTASGVAIGAAAGAIARTPAAAVASVAAGKALRASARRVGDALDAGDLPRARALLPALVGRDADALDASGIAAAVVESVAENTVDAVVAPACWATIGGAPGAGAYRAVNTMDAMVGHRSPRYERFGWSAARLDDLANFVPARATALLVAAIRPRRAAAIARAVRRQARAHPSPNAGVAEAAFAAALGIEVGGPLSYAGRYEDRPRLGTGPRPGPSHVRAAITLASHVELALVACLGLIAIAGGRTDPARTRARAQR